MTAYREVFLACDGNEGDDPLGCPAPRVWGDNAVGARVEAQRAGWTTQQRGRKLIDLCPTHRTDGKAAAIARGGNEASRG